MLKLTRNRYFLKMYEFTDGMAVLWYDKNANEIFSAILGIEYDSVLYGHREPVLRVINYGTRLDREVETVMFDFNDYEMFKDFEVNFAEYFV